MKMSKGILTVISGFSGAGKGTLMKKLTQDYDNYALSVSMTTRAPREGERDGIEYFFVDTETFQERIRQNRMIEYACYCGNYYGTPRDYVQEQLEAGKDVILEIEIQGALQIR
ncbi:MAG: guanylate kinase, partial [Lachnospiraceae bacterium]|nr:guanylate kinase [Lachnospiraceae bacterium]